jgi:hypothetical protein
MSGAVSAFVSRYLPDAQAVSAQTGLSPDFVLGVAGQESGWGQHYVGNNLFGIGNETYATPDDSFTAFGNLISSSPNYTAVMNAGGDPQAEAAALGTTPYNPAGATYGAAVGNTTQMVSNLTGGLSGNTTDLTGGDVPFDLGDGSSSSSSSGLPSWLYQNNFQGPGGTLTTPITGNPLTEALNSAMGASSSSSSSLNWLEEVSIRALMVIIGLALIMGGFYLMGVRQIRADSPLSLKALPGR